MMQVNLRAYGKAPCKGCVRRSCGCHGVCPEYLAYKSEIERIRAQKRREMDSGRASHWLWKEKT